MSIDTEVIERALELLVEAGATRVLIFGSARDDPAQARDLDLACSGIAPEDFFTVYGRLMRALDVPVDLVDLDLPTPFTRLVEKRGRVIHGHP